MKMLGMVFAGLCVLHLLALAGVVGWAAATDRIDRDRVEAALELFREPRGAEPDEAADELAAAEIEGRGADVDADAIGTADRVERMFEEAASATIAERLEAEQLRHEITLRRLERTREEVQSLYRTLRLAQDRVETQREELEQQEQALTERLDEIQQQQDDEGFQRVVNVLESLPPRQSKQMFMELMEQEGPDQVVSYLMEMQPRRASAVLREFQTPEEIRRAVELTQLLRARGSRLVEQLEDVG